MTDNRTTELLREGLTERGIEYAESQDHFRTRFRFNYCEACGDYLNEIEVMGACITASKSYLTPEQAIAATLGEDEKLLHLAHHAWDIAVCAMQGMPIPASWGNAVEKGLRERGIDVDKLPYVVPDATLGDGEYEAKMDALLCRLTNGKWSKTRQYSLEFMVSCVDEEYEDAYEKECAELGSEREKALEKLVQYALDEGHIDEWWYADALKLGLEANY